MHTSIQALYIDTIVSSEYLSFTIRTSTRTNTHTSMQVFNQAYVRTRGHTNSNEAMIFGRAANHRRTANVDVLHTSLKISTLVTNIKLNNGLRRERR